MTLSNLLHLGLFLLLLQIAICISENRQKNQSPTPETTTTSVNTLLQTLKSQISPSTTTEKSTTSQPKTETITQNKTSIEQRRNRGNTKYSIAYTTTTIKPTKVITTISTNTKEVVKNRQTTIRNDRSLNINTDKYNPELHSENNIYAETQVVDSKKYFNLDNKERLTTEKTWDHSNFETLLLTTPKDDIFDSKFKKMQEDISKSLTTAPKNDAFDDKFSKMHEDISKSLDDKIDRFFNEPKQHPYPDEEHPDTNDTKIDYMRFRNLETMHVEDNKKIHKDFSDEKGMKMEMSSSYNDTKIIDSPGIVVNTIPTNRKDSETKKPDLDQGETIIEKITIEKPNTFISNKIETDPGYLGATEGYEDKPLERKGIYLSKRGSTVQNKEQTIEKSSTEAGIPLDLYPSKAAETLEQNSTRSKDFKKIAKILRKDSDLDNKIPKFLVDSTTKASKIENTSTETSEIVSETNESLLSVMPLDPSTSPPEIDTESPNFTEQTTTEEFETSTLKLDFNEFSTDTPQTEDTTTYTEPTTETVRMEFSYFDMDNTEFAAETDADMMEIDDNNSTDQNSDTKTIPTTETSTESETLNSSVGFKNISKYEYTTELGINEDTSKIENLNLPTENVNKNEIFKKNESIPKAINEITKPPIASTTTTSTSSTIKTEILWPIVTENTPNIEDNHNKNNSENEPPQKQNEINVNGEKSQPAEECDNIEDPAEDYVENNCNNKQNGDDINEGDADLDNHNIQEPITTQTDKKPPLSTTKPTTTTERTTKVTTISPRPETTEFENEKQRIAVSFEEAESTTRSDSIISAEEEDEGGNGGKIAAIVISTVGGICLLVLIVLLVIMKKRQKRFNYGQRCRPVSLDAYSMDNVSIHNSTRRKGVLMMSKRSYGNPAFEDPASPSHPLNYSELLKFANNLEAIKMEFDKIPQVTTKTNELPEGCDVKNRYANVIPLPETRVFLSTIDGVHGSDYINANYVTGAQGTRNYYIACQAPMQNTIDDFWRMIWEQQSKVILMLTHLYENGVEKCLDYLPPSEVLDCHRLFGDFQITLKKREVKDKYIISSLQLKNMVSNSWREITHFWYMGWPEKGVPEEANSLIAFLIEARSYIKISDTKVKETINHTISNGLGMSNSPNPVIVHCSPGTARTGTVIACDIAVREFEVTRKIDIPRIVYRIRRDRASAVQTKEQYCFIYKVINFYATKLTGGIFDSF